MRTSNKYDEILSLPHHISTTRPQMPMSDRAAQFAPFAARKAGGKYVSATGAVKKVDDFERRITMQDGTKIPMDDVLSIDGELFSSLE